MCSRIGSRVFNQFDTQTGKVQNHVVHSEVLFSKRALTMWLFVSFFRCAYVRLFCCHRFLRMATFVSCWVDDPMYVQKEWIDSAAAPEGFCHCFECVDSLKRVLQWERICSMDRWICVLGRSAQMYYWEQLGYSKAKDYGGKNWVRDGLTKVIFRQVICNE